MPETICKTLYACNKCKHEYKEYYAAELCERLPLLEEQNNLKQYNVGDEVNFNNEYGLGSRWVYTSGAGKIVEKKMVRQGDIHQYLYWIETGEGVVFVKDEFGWKTFSPAELKRDSAFSHF